MAIKDWKKTKNKLKWRHRGASTRVIYIGNLTKKYPCDLNERYYVQGENTQETWRFKIFKLKSQAIKYAKAYMRKH